MMKRIVKFVINKGNLIAKQIVIINPIAFEDYLGAIGFFQILLNYFSIFALKYDYNYCHKYIFTVTDIVTITTITLLMNSKPYSNSKKTIDNVILVNLRFYRCWP